MLSFFDDKISSGIEGRKDLTHRVAAFRESIGDKRLLLFHCASAGELEALKPLLQEFPRQEVALAVSYFSPSAKSAIPDGNEFDFADFSPIDSVTSVQAYLNALKPNVIAITKHDVWPNFIWEAQQLSIPLYMINGNFHAKSLKQWPLFHGFHASVYRAFEQILAVSENDAANARAIVGPKASVEAFGDSRFDRVVQRTERRKPLPDHIEGACRGKEVLVAGSTHEVDEDLLIPVIARLRSTLPSLFVIIVPHDPSPAAKARIERRSFQYSLILSDLENGKVSENATILLVNRTKVLADLYRVGHVAYVGGAFGKGVHSVIEPMAHRLPVVCGPNIIVSNEARTAQTEGILKVVSNRIECERLLETWLGNPEALERLHARAGEFVQIRCGTSYRVAQRLMEALRV